MQCLAMRPKSTLAILTGLTTGLGIAFLTSKFVSRLFKRCLCVSHNSELKFVWTTAQDEVTCDVVVRRIKKDLVNFKALGFDCEWVQITQRNRVALIQLATKEGYCGLFQIAHYRRIPWSLKKLLEDKSILKVGVIPHLDAKYLLNDYEINVESTLDIRHLMCDLKSEIGLATVTKMLLGMKLHKGEVRTSNWEQRCLTKDQQEYAAKDALVAVYCFNKLMEQQVPFGFLRGDLFNQRWQAIYDHCAPFLDRPWKLPQAKDLPPLLQAADLDTHSSSATERKKSGQPHSSSPPLDGKRSYRAFCPRKSPLYENAYMLAPDGEVLCTCNTKKAEWYLSKGYATMVEQEPLKIKLTFEPAKRSQGSSAEYYTLEKQNQCVSCGRKDSYVRKKIVPHEYRQFFPDCMKKRQSHDILLLCAPCHIKSNILDLNLRHDLARLCDAPIASDINIRVLEDTKNKSLRSAARALLNKSNRLPEKRHQELINFIEVNFQSPATQDVLHFLKDIDIK